MAAKRKTREYICRPEPGKDRSGCGKGCHVVAPTAKNLRKILSGVEKAAADNAKTKREIKELREQLKDLPDPFAPGGEAPLSKADQNRARRAKRK